MGLTYKTGTFAANTATGNQVVDTGTGVDGKAVILYGHKKVTSPGDDPDIELFFGCATSSSQRWSVWAENKDNIASSDAVSRNDDTKCITIQSAAGGSNTADGAADFVSFGTGADSGKFTINWTDAPASAYIIHYIFLGGTDITNAKAGKFLFPSAAGSQGVTDPGFQPDFLMLATSNDSNDVASPADMIHGRFFMGMASGPSNQGCIGWKSENARAQWDCYRFQSNARILTTFDNQADINSCTLTSFDTNGFTLNWSGSLDSTPQSHIFYLALKGGQYQVGSFSSQTGTGNFNVSTNFQASGLMVFSAGAMNAAGYAQNSGFTFGAADSSSSRGVVAGVDDESSERAASKSSAAAVYINHGQLSPTGGVMQVDGEIDFVSFNSTNMTLNQTNGDSNAHQVLFAVFGASVSGTPYTQSLGGGITPAGSILKFVDQRAAKGGLTPIGALKKEVTDTQLGSLSSAGGVFNSTNKQIGGGLIPSGALARVLGFNRTLLGTIGSAGSLVFDTSQNKTGDVAPSGSLKKDIAHKKEGGITPLGNSVTTRFFTEDVFGAVGAAGSIVKLVSKQVSGILVPAGSLRKEVMQQLIGMLTPTGTVQKAGSKTFSGALTPAGVLLKDIFKRLVSSITPGGAIGKVVSLVKQGTITSSGQVSGAGNPTLSVSGAITPSGIVQSSMTQTKSGAVVSTGALIKAVSIIKQGSVASSGIVTAARVYGKLVTGVLVPFGSLIRTFSKSLSGTTNLAGSLIKTVAKYIAGLLAPSGVASHDFVGDFEAGQVRATTSYATNLSVQLLPTLTVEVYEAVDQRIDIQG